MPNARSPRTPRNSRLVARMRTPGAARQVTLGERRDRPHDRLTIVEHQQQLTVSQPVLERVGHRLIRSVPPRPTRRPPTGQPVRRLPRPRDSRTTPRSGTNANAAVAASNASRVLPLPPGPVRVTSRPSPSASSTSASSARRPTNESTGAGRLFVAVSVRNGGKSRGSDGCVSCQIPTSPTSFRW